MTPWASMNMHMLLLCALARQGLKEPTPIQRAIVAPAIAQLKDIVGAAQTGSGKTLAYLLPLLSRLLRARAGAGLGIVHPDETDAAALLLQSHGHDAAAILPVAQRVAAAQRAAKARAGQGAGNKIPQLPGQVRAAARAVGLTLTRGTWRALPALIVVPTRELAVQVASVATTITQGTLLRVGVLVGGLAEVKQGRVLDSCPDLLVATPGRLAAWLRRGHSYLVWGLPRLLGLVLDEADRLIEGSHFVDLEPVLDAIAPLGAAPVPTTSQSGGDEDAPLPNGPRQTMLVSATLGSMSEAAQAGALRSLVKAKMAAAARGHARDAAAVAMRKAAAAGDEDDMPSDAEEAVNHVEVDESSVTLTAATRTQIQSAVKRMPALQALLARLSTRPRPMLVRVHRDEDGKEQLLWGPEAVSGAARATPAADSAEQPRAAVASKFTLPEGLHLQRMTVPTDQRDAALYQWLLSTGQAGRVLVFVPSIRIAKELASMLRILELPVYALHGSMKQKARLQVLERWQREPRGIAVATDVAARGLDIPEIAGVVHWAVPSNVETWVHRCGRTARAPGGRGLALTIVTPVETKRWDAVEMGLALSWRGNTGRGPLVQEVEFDTRYKRPLIHRVSLARRIVTADAKCAARSVAKGWLSKAARDADMELDENDLVDAGLTERAAHGEDAEDDVAAVAERSKTDAAAVGRWRAELKHALRQPLVPRSTSTRYIASAPVEAHTGETAGAAHIWHAAQPVSALLGGVDAAATAAALGVNVARQMASDPGSGGKAKAPKRSGSGHKARTLITKQDVEAAAAGATLGSASRGDDALMAQLAAARRRKAPPAPRKPVFDEGSDSELEWDE